MLFGVFALALGACGADEPPAATSPTATPDAPTSGDSGWQNFDPIDLTGANLRNADMSGVSMFQGTLEDADLTGANLRGAQLRSASLKNAILRDADLTDANLSFADDRGADFTGAIFCNTIMPKGETNNDGC